MMKRSYDLQFDSFGVKFECSDFEVYANGGDVRVAVRVVSESQQQAALADSTVSNQQQLEQIVVLWIHLITIFCNTKKQHI